MAFKLFHHTKAPAQPTAQRSAELAAVLEHGSGAERRGAVRALASTGPAAVDLLLRQLDVDPEWEVRNEILAALGRLGDPRAVEAVVAAADPLAEHRVDHDVAVEALRALQVPTQEIAGMLARGAPDRRRGAVVVLRELADPAGTPAVIGALTDPEPSVRVQAALALGRLAVPEAFDPLVAALADPEPLVRARAVNALGALAGGAARVYNPSLRGFVTQYAAERRNPEAVPPLLSALADPAPDVRSAAFDALRYVDQTLLPMDTVDTAVTALGDEDDCVRRDAALFLLHTREPGRSEHAVAAIRTALAGVRRGGLDEPYCSQYCYDQGGEAIARAMLVDLPPGSHCSACGELVMPRGLGGGPYGFVYYKPGVEHWVGDLHATTLGTLLDDREKELLLFHQNDTCVTTVRAEVSRSPMCVRCSRPLRPASAASA
jgi:HEAT repeat protein